VPATHHHDRRNGAAINIHAFYDDDRGLRVYDGDRASYEHELAGHLRRRALEHIDAAIAAELGDRPDPAGVVPGDGPVPDGRADRSELDELRDRVVDSAALLIRRLSDGVTDVDKRNATKWLAARDR
jgi:hypothetical protein